MSMSDLELLQLVDTVKEKQRGPKGEPGVGIDKIEQFDATGFTLRLTDGSFQRIDLPTPKDGEPGPIGPVGPKGETGSAGRPGRDGSQGMPGRDGQDGLPGSFIETAVVNSNGHLLLGISDGAIIDVGRVVGPAGATGAVGATGLAGESGKDGAAVLSGPRAPSADDGVEGDHWIDISSAEFSFYKKNGEGWNKLAELRQVPRDLRMPAPGSGGGGGGGNGELQNTRTLPLINGGSTIRKQAQARGLPPIPGAMDTQEDANLYFLACLQTEDVTVSDSLPRPPYAQGQLWFCTNPEDLTLYVYDGAVWVPAAPPVSLDGIEAGIAGLTYAVDELKTITTGQGNEIADAKSVQYGFATAIKHLDDDQKRQDEQLAEIAGEIEDLQPSIERGEWVYEPNPEGPNSPAPGSYTAYVVVSEDYCKTQHNECLMSTGGDQALATECNRKFDSCLAKVGEPDTDVPWHEVEWLILHRNDIEGRNHLFGDVTPDMYVEALNADGTGHGLYQIISKSVDPRKCGLHVKPVHSSGHPNGKALFKIFKMAEAANPEDYVMKSGDEMAGPLHIKADSKDSNAALVVQANELEHSNSDIFQVKDRDGKIIFFVSGLGNVGLSSQSNFTPSRDYDLTTKGYVDAAAAPGPVTFSWKYTGPDNQSVNLRAGEFYGPKKPVFDGSNYFSWYFHNTPAQPAGNRFGSYQNNLKYNFQNYQVLGSFWFNDSGAWKQKGHFWVKSIEYNYKERAVFCVSGYHIRNSDDDVNEFVSQFTDGKIYGLTIGGFF